jgi:hypothetical protein
MSGVLVDFGQIYFLEVIFKNTSPGNLFLGLMEEGSFAAPGDLPSQVGTGITEITGTGYARLTITRNTDWTRTSETVTTTAAIEFTVGAGGWPNVRGYFVATSGTYGAATAIWAESFPLAQQGNKVAGDKIRITPSFTMKDDSE